MMIRSSHLLISHLCIFGEMFVSVIVFAIFKLDCLLLLNSRSSLYILDTSSLSHMNFKYFLSFHGLFSLS